MVAMRIAFLVSEIVLLAMIPALGAEVQQAAEDPWLGKTRAEVVERLGKPDKAKRSGRDGEKLTYKFRRLDPSAAPRLDVRLLSVPGVGIVAKATKAGIGSNMSMSVVATETDEHGRPIGSGVAMTETASITYDPKTGKQVSSDLEASTKLGKVKLFLTLDAQGRVTEWSASR